MPNHAWPSLTDIAARPRVRRAIAWIAGAIIAFGAIGFLALPPLLRPALERALSTALDRKVTIERLKFDPFALSGTLGDVVIADHGEGPPLLTMGELYVNGELASLLRWAPVIREITATRPALHLVRNADKTYNVSDLIGQAWSEPSGPTPRFSVSNIQVIDGSIDFDDRPENRRHQITEIRIGIPFLSSLPTQTETKVQPNFSALVNGRPVAITGETRPFKDTHETALHWDLSALSLPLYLDYLPVALPVKVESGRLDAKVDLRFVGRGRDPPILTLTGTIDVADLALSERSGTPLLRVPMLAVAVDRLDLVGAAAELRSIAADGLEIHVRREREGALNLATLAPADAATAGSKPQFQFRVGSIVVRHGKVDIADATVTPAFATTLNDVAVEITNLANVGEQKATVSSSFVTGARERLTHRGTLGLAPFSVDGRLEVSGLKLGPLFPYFASALNLAVDEGALDLSTDVRFGGTGPATAFALTNLNATTTNLRMRLPDAKDPLWRVPMLAVHGGSVDISGHAISFDAVEGRGAVATVTRGSDGHFNFERLIRTAEGGASPTEGGETWRVAARRVALDDFAATLIDETVTPPAHIALSRVSVTAENLSNAAKVKGHAKLQATVNKRGALSLAGPIATAPFAATLDVNAKNIDLIPFQPYVSQAARVLVAGGSASARGAFEVATSPVQQTAFKGDITLTDVVGLEEDGGGDLVKWKTLSLASVDAHSEPRDVRVGEITLDGLVARLMLNENGEFNLQQLARDRAPAAHPVAADTAKTVQLATPPGTATTWLKLGKATLTDGDIQFTDHFIRPNYSAHITNLAGSLSTLAFTQPADLELRGNLQEGAPVEIVGRINPLAQNLYLDLKASATDIELPPLSTYSGKYVGYGIEKGKLSVQVHYLVDERKLTAENTVVLDQLTFGQKIDSPDAIKAPVLLAAALLKDRNGVIKFDLPVAGSIDDPQFSVGGIVFRALVNLILKIVTAPFAVLGSLGGHGEELAYVEFAPGSASLDATGDRKIKSIAKALTDRPALKLDVVGRADPSLDREGLKRAMLDHKIRLEKFNDLVKGGEPPSSVDAVEVAASEYEPLLLRVYKAADFPKPRNAIGLLKDLPRGEMETLLLTNMKVSDEDLRLLGERRAQTVRSKFVDAEHVPGDRVFLVAFHVDASDMKDKGKPTRVDFALHQ